jgi:membrane fusion protein (multidrug efflux system)
MSKYLIWFTLVDLLFTTACNQPTTPTPRSEKTPTPHWVETITVQPESLNTNAVYTGSLRAKKIVHLVTQEEGRIIQLPYYEGDVVTANTLLVQLDDSLLQAELDKAIAIHKQARVNVQRLQKLAQQKLIAAEELLRAQTEQEVAQAEENILRTRLSYMTITAPFTGIITARLAEPGEVVSPNTSVLTLIDPLSLVIEVAVPERLFSQLHLQELVSVRIDALGTQNLPGLISRLHPTIDPLTRLGKVEVVLKPLPQEARAGQFCRVTIDSKMTPRLTIPYSALRRDQEGEYVFLLDAQQLAQRQSVRSGLHLADKVEILEGLTAGQTVINKGFLGLQSGKGVQAIKSVN